MEYKLSEIFDLQMGKTPDRHNPDYWADGSEPWISIADLSKCSKYIEDTTELISQSAISGCGIKIIPENTVIMSFKLSIGKLAITPRPMYSNEAIMAFIDKGIVSVDPNYLYYLLKHKDWDEGTNKAVMGKTLNKATLSDVKIRVHAPEEQAEIVEVLDKTMGIITARKQQLAELNNLVKARFVEMFGEYANAKESAGLFLLNMRNGVSPSTTGEFSEKVLTLSAVTQGVFDKGAWKNGLFDEIPNSDKRVKATDFYMCRGNGNKSLVGAGVYSNLDYPDLVFPDTVIAASVDTSKILLPYLFYAWKQPEVREQIESGARTTNGTYKINQKIISSVNIAIPPMELQTQFAAFVEQVDKSKVAVQKGLDEAQLLFDSLMQEYFR